MRFRHRLDASGPVSTKMHAFLRVWKAIGVLLRLVQGLDGSERIETRAGDASSGHEGVAMASSHARWNEPDLREGYGSHNRANGYDPERTSPDEFTVGIEGPPPRPKAGGEYSLLGAHRRCGNARGDVAGACDVDEGGGLGQEIRMDVRARCEETEGSSRADDVGVGGRLTTQETCRYDTWTSPEKAALMGGRGR